MSNPITIIVNPPAINSVVVTPTDTAIVSLASGVQGPQGPQGLQGLQGVQGIAGLQGGKGDKGDAGVIGAKGDKGNTGATGATGSVGATGATGQQGPAGVGIDFKGSVANSSELPSTGNATGDAYTALNNGHFYIWDGSAWIDNGASVQGPQGVTGATGAAGPKGDTGSAGATGAQGPKGDTGDIGATGIQGVAGDIGIQGIQGIQGTQGPKGDRGVQGIDGIQGIQGIQGNAGAGFLFKGSVATPELLPLIGNSVGDGRTALSNSHFYFWDGIAWIDVGAAVQGPQGIEGPIGAIGPQGIRGIDGTRGAVGPQGPQGPSGGSSYPWIQPDGPQFYPTETQLTENKLKIWKNPAGLTPPIFGLDLLGVEITYDKVKNEKYNPTQDTHTLSSLFSDTLEIKKTSYDTTWFIANYTENSVSMSSADGTTSLYAGYNYDHPQGAVPYFSVNDDSGVNNTTRNELKLGGVYLEKQASSQYINRSIVAIDSPYRTTSNGDSFGLTAAWREISICENGVTKKAMVLMTESYEATSSGHHYGLQY